MSSSKWITTSTGTFSSSVKELARRIDEADAVLGGESSGGLTVRGHIHGKDSVYAASLFAEMVSVTGKTPSQMLNALEKKFGKFIMVEDNLHFAPDYKSVIERIVFEEKRLPEFSVEVEKVNYEDGCKVYFTDGSFVICRFSGTEPLLRIFAEGADAQTAKNYIEAFRTLLALD
jgi:phosphomannomutase